MRNALGTIQVRAAVGATLVVAAALVATGLLLLHVLQTELTAKAVAQAMLDAQRTAQALNSGATLEEVELNWAPLQVRDADGHVIAASRTAGDVTGEPPVTSKGPDPVPSSVIAATPTPLSPIPTAKIPTSLNPDPELIDAGGGDLRWAAQETAAIGNEKVTVYAAASFETERSAMRAVRLAMGIGLPPLLVVVAVSTWWVARRSLRPVEAMRRELEAITTSADLTRRVPVPLATDEISRLARTTNDTLSALERAVDRQRQFVSDASHELRSPIASLRTQLEVGARHPGLLDLGGAIDDTIRLQDLTADLLLLARLDVRQAASADAVRLSDVVDDQVRRHGGGRVPVLLINGAEGMVEGSADQLGRVLRNLLENALRHATSQVVVELDRDGEYLLVTVADDGNGVPPEERERIFERFVRLDDARSRDEGGSGLGLAIARDIVVRHGGTLTVDAVQSGPGAVFAVRLPIAG